MNKKHPKEVSLKYFEKVALFVVYKVVLILLIFINEEFNENVQVKYSFHGELTPICAFTKGKTIKIVITLENAHDTEEPLKHIIEFILFTYYHFIKN